MKNRSTLIFLICYQSVFAQISVSNLFEYQVGNLPEQDPSNLTTHFDQLSLSYRFEDLLFYGRFEHFQSVDKSFSYDAVRQWSLSFSRQGFSLLVGHFYQIFGRGLLLRTYEIPGVIREEAGLRTRYGFYRDINGIRLRYENKWLEFTALRGKPLREDLPPTISNDFRRENLIEGAQANIFIADWTFSGIYLRHNNTEFNKEYSSMAVAENLPFNIQLYTEYAHQLNRTEKFFDLSKKTAHALYMGMNMILGPAGISLEYKDYNNFLLGFNDPPPLVKEHAYMLLNRTTHSLEPLNEAGWQVEFIYNLTTDLSMVANMAKAQNKTSIKDFFYEEKFIEIGYHLSPQITVKGFADLALEDLRLEKDRYTWGVYLETEWISGVGAIIDLEYQDYWRMLTSPLKVINQLASVTLSYAPDLSVGVTIERTNDNAESVRDWIGLNAGYQYNQQHLINLFYGKRRGGNACTAGVCYQVLPFEGFELRLTSNI